MMLQWLILSMLFVHNSLAFGLYDDIDDDLLWPRSRPGSVDTATPSNNNDCKKDILILWDNSQSVGTNNFKDKVIPFLRSLVNNTKLNVAKEGTHLGFTTFSTAEKTESLLTIGQKTEAGELMKWLNRLDYTRDLMGDQTFTGKAFQLASTETFKLASPLNHRPEIEDVVMLFTDGKPNPDAGRRNQVPVAKSFSTELKKKKVKIIGLAVGKEKVLKDFYHYIVDWSSSPEKEYVFKTEIANLDSIVNKLVGPLCAPAVDCFCNKRLAPFTVYAEPGQQTGRAFWPEHGASCSNGATPTPGPVDPPDAVPGGRFSLGKHVITYLYSYNDAGKPKVLECPIEFTVVPCECPTTQTVNAKVKPGDTTVDVSWEEPSPRCPTTPSQNNPETSGSFSVGNYTRTYRYRYIIPGKHSFDIVCHVKIVITGKFCGEKIYDPATEVCCCGKIETKKSGSQCCGLRYYDTSVMKCCNNQNAILVPLEGNCP